MTNLQDTAADLRSALGSRSTRLTEEEYSGLIKAGFDSPEALLDAREKSLAAIPLRVAAVDAVLAWQTERKPLGELLSTLRKPQNTVDDLTLFILKCFSRVPLHVLSAQQSIVSWLKGVVLSLEDVKITSIQIMLSLSTFCLLASS